MNKDKDILKQGNQIEGGKEPRREEVVPDSTLSTKETREDTSRLTAGGYFIVNGVPNWRFYLVAVIMYIVGAVSWYYVGKKAGDASCQVDYLKIETQELERSNDVFKKIYSNMPSDADDARNYLMSDD